MKMVVGVAHGSQEWGGNGMKKGFGCFSSQEWGGKGLGRPKIKHEKWFGCFMAPETGGGKGLGMPKMVPESVVGAKSVVGMV